MDNPCPVGGAPILLPVLLPFATSPPSPFSTKAVLRFNSSIEPVETCKSATPCNNPFTVPPVLYFNPQRYVDPPYVQISVFGANVVKNTAPIVEANGSVMTLSAQERPDDGSRVMYQPSGSVVEVAVALPMRLWEPSSARSLPSHIGSDSEVMVCQFCKARFFYPEETSLDIRIIYFICLVEISSAAKVYRTQHQDW